MREYQEKHKDRLKEFRKKKYADFWKPRYIKRRRILNLYKEKRGCDTCGYNKHGVALDFDHIDLKTKKFNISHRLCNATLKSLFKEIRKCQLLCANCHRIKTLEERQFDNIPRSSRTF